MTLFIEQLSTYAKYHRDPRNIATHLVGVPMIVFSVMVLLAGISFNVVGVTISVAMIGYVLTMGYYLRLNLIFGLLMCGLMGAGLYFAQILASISTLAWLASGIGLFVVGWVIQFVGHYYEGKKPAFVDDLVGLLIGPLFVTAEVLFAVGLFSQLKQQVEQNAGEIKVQTPNPTSI